jgi:hypothetical protein
MASGLPASRPRSTNRASDRERRRLAIVAFRLQNRALMTRAWLLALLALLAAPATALAQKPPNPTAGQITFAEEAHTSTDAFINDAECDGSGIVRLAWQITGTFPIGGVTYKLYAANKVTTGPCPRQPDASISLIAREVLPVSPPSSINNPMLDATYATSAIVAAVEKSACNQSATEDIFLCAEGVDPNNASTTVGPARGTISLDRRPPDEPGGVFAEPGDTAVNVFWDALPGTAVPTADYYRVDAQPILTTTAAFDPTPIHTSDPVVGSPRPHRFGGLVNTVVYRVRVFAFSPADNRSLDPTYDVTAQALPSADFWESYKAAGGREEGGCASGPGGFAAIAGTVMVLAVAARRRRR